MPFDDCIALFVVMAPVDAHLKEIVKRMRAATTVIVRQPMNFETGFPQLVSGGVDIKRDVRPIGRRDGKIATKGNGGYQLRCHARLSFNCCSDPLEQTPRPFS
jgi:hypothetical protein